VPLQQTVLKASGGAGTSGSFPLVTWIVLYDEAVSKGAQYGFYMVYLFSADLERVFLSMNQGVHEVAQGYGQTNSSLRELERRAALLRSRMKSELGRFSVRAIDLSADGYTQKAYTASHAFGRAYQTAALPPRRSSFPIFGSSPISIKF